MRVSFFDHALQMGFYQQFVIPATHNYLSAVWKWDQCIETCS